MARVLITNDGLHSNETWAMATAEQLVPVDGPNMQGERLMAARRLQLKIADVLVPHNDRVVKDERSRLNADADSHFATEHDPSPYLDRAVADIQEATVGTEWEAQFKTPETVNAIRSVIHSHFSSAMDVHRQDHARKNPSEAGNTYLASTGTSS